MCVLLIEKSVQKEPQGNQEEPKGTRRELKGAKMEPKASQVEPKGTRGDPRKEKVRARKPNGSHEAPELEAKGSKKRKNGEVENHKRSRVSKVKMMIFHSFYNKT